ncbi:MULTISPECIES: ROK family protein [Sphingobacterium]|uniref:ROK family protein n=1 Tax=Sphingobacterium litopenaei TaxID=2763500 RepID=A0ABR7YAP9_9SPHI|nr:MULTISPECIES: ROK family protein [Sphingobacterium]MBD1428360.1 ROK family protein [Sphingobacterium litopenaei]NGM72206.1 ROK family protein [Sphingobacterium sp. SGL-16]
MMDQFYTQIIKSLYFSGPQSIAEISNSIGKSVPIIAKSIQSLIDQNFVIPDGLRASTGGRRAAAYKLNKEKIGNTLTISINRYSIIMGLYNIFNEPLIENIDININQFDDLTIYHSIVVYAEKIIETYNTYPIFAIGITTPGFVDSHKGVNNSYSKESPLYDLPRRLKNDLKLDVYIENDSSAIAIAEKNFGKAKNTNHSLIINLTWGVGLGIIVDQQLFRGFNGFAGEFSHIPLADENKLCSCGKKGCLEVEASLESAIEYIKERLKEGEVSLLAPHVESKDKSQFLNSLIQAYKLGDQLSIHGIKKMGFMLGKGIATLIHILNPEKVIISGIGAAFGAILLPEIQSSIHIFCIPRLSQRTSIEISNLDNIQTIASACVAVMQSDNLIKNQ